MFPVRPSAGHLIYTQPPDIHVLIAGHFPSTALLSFQFAPSMDCWNLLQIIYQLLSIWNTDLNCYFVLSLGIYWLRFVREKSFPSNFKVTMIVIHNLIKMIFWFSLKIDVGLQFKQQSHGQGDYVISNFHLSQDTTVAQVSVLYYT